MCTRLDRIPGGCSRLVAADLGFQPEMSAHRVQRRLREQRGTGVVEVNAMSTPGSLSPQGIDVHDSTLPDALRPQPRAL
jgi:hypothetical protein